MSGSTIGGGLGLVPLLEQQRAFTARRPHGEKNNAAELQARPLAVQIVGEAFAQGRKPPATTTRGRVVDISV